MTVTEVVGNVGSAMMEMIKDPLARNTTSATGSPNRPAGGYGGPQIGRPDPVSSEFEGAHWTKHVELHCRVCLHHSMRRDRQSRSFLRHLLFFNFEQTRCAVLEVDVLPSA